MSLRFTFLGFAEGATFDARGQIALVGFMPQAAAVPSFPAQIPLNLIMIVDEDDRDASSDGQTAHIRVTVTNQDGDVVFLVEQSPTIADKAPNGMGSRIAVVANLPVTAAKPGTYRYTATLTVTGPRGAERLEQSADIDVLSQDEVDSRLAGRGPSAT